MIQETEPAFTGAANVTQLGKWLEMSRNRVEDFAEADIEPMTYNLMTLAEAAVELGSSAQDLNKDRRRRDHRSSNVCLR
ncbi:hypothetical protein [Phaeobacter sp. NW0010-22]|uniref:hypothetical protein n=1 Tax=Phaeobacter sp. NW0010-22 TaxID=3135907 RepID=UPI0031072EC2